MSFTQFNDTTNDAAAAATNTAEINVYLNDSGTLGLSLDGTFAMDWTNIVVNDEDDELQMSQATTNRQTGFNTLEPAYYIKVQYDLNGAVEFNPGPTNDETGVVATNDDSWSLPRIDFDSRSGTNDADATYKLPMARYTSHVGAMTVSDPTGRSKAYGVDLTINLENDGTVSGNALLNDETTFTGLVDDVYQLAQDAYWDVLGEADVDPPGKNDEDLLAATINPERITTHFATALAHIENDVNDTNSNGNVLNSWAIQLAAVPHHPGSNLSQFGQVNNVNDGSTLFATGSKIVINSAKRYTVTVTREAGRDAGVSTMVDDYVYGIIEQS